MPNKNSRKNEKQTAIAPKISEHNFMLNKIRKKRRGKEEKLDAIEYMVQRIKRRCVERCEQKCMVHKNGKEKKEDTQRLFESFFSLVLSLFFSVCIYSHFLS